LRALRAREPPIRPTPHIVNWRKRIGIYLAGDFSNSTDGAKAEAATTKVLGLICVDPLSRLVKGRVNIIARFKVGPKESR